MGKISKKVAVYARVSLETDRLAHSLSAQSDYYSGFIRGKLDWEFVGIYADSFISGTETSRRSEFQRLISDCESGRVDLVLCKSISRFARNTVDLLKTVRHLKELGVEVRFEKENISSLSEDGELLLTILASFAQEESRSVSENVKWGIRKRYRAGDAGVRNKVVFGYRFDGERYVVQEDEARAVKQIFDDYLKGVPLRKISENLQKSGFRTARGFDFSHNQIKYIVQNPIYTGKIVLQKTFVKDFITHKKVKNQGELPQYIMENCHEPIISEDIFARAEEESRRRAAEKRAYYFSGKLICGMCGKPFSRFSNYGKYVYWRCRSCQNTKLKEDRLNALLGLKEEEIPQTLSKITILDKTLDVEFYDGRVEKWVYE